MGFNHRPAANQTDTSTTPIKGLERVIPVLWPLCPRYLMLHYTYYIVYYRRLELQAKPRSCYSKPTRTPDPCYVLYYQLTVSAKEPLLHYRHAHRLHCRPIQSFHHVQRFIPQCPSWVQLPRLCCDAKGIQCRLQKTRKGYWWLLVSEMM